MKLWNVIAFIFIALLGANCSIDVAIDDLTADDFLNTTILASSRGVGDGQDSASITIQLKNSDDSPVIGYKPEFEFVDHGGSTIEGNGITQADCSISNAQGISTCILKSIIVGSRRISFNNILVDIIGQVFFDPPSRNGSFFSVVSSSQINQEAGGYSVTSFVGAPFAGLKQEVDGYIIYTNTTGSITPTD